MKVWPPLVERTAVTGGAGATGGMGAADCAGATGGVGAPPLFTTTPLAETRAGTEIGSLLAERRDGRVAHNPGCRGWRMHKGLRKQCVGGGSGGFGTRHLPGWRGGRTQPVVRGQWSYTGTTGLGMRHFPEWLKPRGQPSTRTHSPFGVGCSRGRSGEADSDGAAPTLLFAHLGQNQSSAWASHTAQRRAWTSDGLQGAGWRCGVAARYRD